MATQVLQINNFQEKQDFVKKEHQVLAYWDEDNTFEKSVQQRPEDKRYVFYDGPPFATGTPHYGHILASTIKDVIPRYWTMKGYRVDRVWGWDCHGIPIENMIEKELDLKGGKKGIEALGIDKFNAACKAAILRFDTEWEQVIRRIGRWVDFKHSYKTMDTSYMESVWWAFKSLYEKGLVYEGRKVILYCSRCATPLSNFEIAMDNSYKELPGPSTTYKYKVKGKADTYLLAWSTTPWNKLATPALAVNPTLTYVEVTPHFANASRGTQGKVTYILAETRLEMLKQEPYTIVKKYTGKELEQFEFELHYDFYPRNSGEKAGVVIADEYVTDAEGTGIVTLAIYGEDDYRVMTAHNVQLVEHVDSEGKLKPEVTPWAGLYILKANPLVNEDLQQRNLIYYDEERVHNVPVCYRCETRLYHAPVPAWFIDVQKLKPDLVKQNQAINWYPDHLKHGRFGKGLETAPDWNISRSRYWGTPMPVWISGENIRIIGSLEELKQWAVEPKQVEQLTDIHREFLDDIEVWVDDAKTVKGKRIPEVFDCWVESGSMPYASIHYPFEHKDIFETSHPAQFIAEYIAQTRAWFYTLHVMSVGLFGKHTFENAVTTGTIQAEDGQKMSKSKKNYPDPSLLFEKYGVDALRFYLMGSVVMKAENINFSEAAVREVYQKIISLFWNTFSFYKLYSPEFRISNFEFRISEVSHVMDRWIVSRTTGVIEEVTKAMDGYDTANACRILQQFLDELSTWYLRRSRERCKTDQQSYAVFGWVLEQTALLLAPITPFISELVWQNMGQENSVHLAQWPTVDSSLRHLSLEEHMNLARKVVTAGHAWRKEQNKPVKEQLRRIPVSLDEEMTWLNEFPATLEVIAEELNVLEIEIQGKVYQTADATISDQELGFRNQTRTVIRTIQSLRKEQNLGVKETVVVTLPTQYQQLPKQYLDEIAKTTVASTLSWGDSFAVSTV